MWWYHIVSIFYTTFNVLFPSHWKWSPPTKIRLENDNNLFLIIFLLAVLYVGGDGFSIFNVVFFFIIPKSTLDVHLYSPIRRHTIIPHYMSQSGHSTIIVYEHNFIWCTIKNSTPLEENCEIKFIHYPTEEMFILS